jgi:glycosyltransferase involved in cell wall biosynthesis
MARRFDPALAVLTQLKNNKSIAALAEAFSRLRHLNKRLRLIGHVDARIRTYLETAKLDRAEFVGGKPFEQVLEAMSQAHVTVLPSVDDGFGMGAGRGHGLRLAGHQHGQH